MPLPMMPPAPMKPSLTMISTRLAEERWDRGGRSRVKDSGKTRGRTRRA